MSDYGRMTGPARLEFRRVFDAPIERVWEFIVDPELRKTWFCAGKTDRHEGGIIVLDFDHSRLSNRSATTPSDQTEGQSTFTGTITEYQPPVRFAFLWPDMPGQKNTKVTISLSEVSDRKTELHLKHEGLHSSDHRLGATAGWHAHLDILADKLAGTPHCDFWDLHEKLEPEYAKRLKEEVKRVDV